MDTVTAHVRQADRYLRVQDYTRASHACLQGAEIARQLFLVRVEASLLETAANLQEIQHQRTAAQQVFKRR